MCRGSLLLALFFLSGNPAYADVLSSQNRDASRGELLYATHCIACHNEQVHWRDKTLATEWTSLQAEVDRWQKLARLGWADDDVAAVARYLNALHYHYPAPE